MINLDQTQDQEDQAAEASLPVTEEAYAEPAQPSVRDNHKRQRRLDALTWVPNESVAVLNQQMVLGSQTMLRNWNVLFVRAQTTLYMLQEILPSTGALEASRGLEKAIDERLIELESELQNEIGRLTTLANGDGIDEIPAKNFAKPETFDVKIYTPGAIRYLRLIQNADQLIWITEYLWLQGVIKSDHKWQIINRWKKLLWGMVKFTSSTWIRARKSLQATQKAQNERKVQGDRKARRNADTAQPGDSVTDASTSPSAEEEGEQATAEAA